MSSDDARAEVMDVIIGLADRVMVARAIGVLMERSAVSSEEATRCLDGLVGMTGIRQGRLARMIVEGQGG